MLNTLKHTLLTLVRAPELVVWSLAFPLVLMGVFSLMFGPLDEMAAMDPIPIAVVEPDSSPEGEAFATFIDAVSVQGVEETDGAEGAAEEPLFDVLLVDSASAAEQAVIDSTAGGDPLLGYVQLVDGVPEVHLRDSLSPSGTTDYTEALILTTVMDEYRAKAALAAAMLASNPAALASPAVAVSLADPVNATEQVSVTQSQPSETARYYFALMGMTALFGGAVGLHAVQRLKPNASALGARRAVGALSHGKALAATLGACWLMNFACLTVAYLFLCLAVGIDFAGRDAECLCVTAAASVMALSLGCAVSAIPRVAESAKTGILTGVVCFSALFAGLYGQPTMELADRLAASVPWVAWVNPASQVAQAFYSVMYYDDAAAMVPHIAALLVMALVFFALAVGSLRRQRYASV
ncbi:ABC transporter permease [Adlercreutzia muris]|uniref:ABC transporter permease n=1 Tax=Adlercreutzia muris TaxID=1796610 RepID=UPI001F589888|nr:ABC transporter permease [Adlercreutzia muris]